MGHLWVVLSKSVIPANAGIQHKTWTPASAGVTDMTVCHP
jgi:hypothetical protein